jgi:hypothetical protein
MGEHHWEAEIMSRRAWILVIVAAAVAVVAVTAVGGTVLADTHRGTICPCPPPVSPAPTSPGSGGGTTVTARDTDNGHTVNLAVGDQLVVVLASTYWHFATLDDPRVLADRGPAVVAASPLGHGCVPGGGCGTVTVRYVAVAAGQVTVAADRTSCGEAMACTGGNGTYRLHVVVG